MGARIEALYNWEKAINGKKDYAQSVGLSEMSRSRLQNYIDGKMQLWQAFVTITEYETLPPAEVKTRLYSTGEFTPLDFKEILPNLLKGIEKIIRSSFEYFNYLTLTDKALENYTPIDVNKIIKEGAAPIPDQYKREEVLNLKDKCSKAREKVLKCKEQFEARRTALARMKEEVSRIEELKKQKSLLLQPIPKLSKRSILLEKRNNLRSIQIDKYNQANDRIAFIKSKSISELEELKSKRNQLIKLNEKVSAIKESKLLAHRKAMIDQIRTLRNLQTESIHTSFIGARNEAALFEKQMIEDVRRTRILQLESQDYKQRSTELDKLKTHYYKLLSEEKANTEHYKDFEEKASNAHETDEQFKLFIMRYLPPKQGYVILAEYFTLKGDLTELARAQEQIKIFEKAIEVEQQIRAEVNPVKKEIIKEDFIESLAAFGFGGYL